MGRAALGLRGPIYAAEGSCAPAVAILQEGPWPWPGVAGSTRLACPPTWQRPLQVGAQQGRCPGKFVSMSGHPWR